MRDPDLIVRAQQAATALESAWCRWRNMHGLAADPAPAVSSYVGFSLDAPWGQPRIVFGICAEEAEQLATLLDRHDCVGPVHASVKAKPVGATHGSRPEDDQGQDVRSQDVRSQDVRSQDVRSQDVRSQDGHGQDGRDQGGRDQDGRVQDGRDQDGRVQDGRVQDGRVQKQAEPAADAGPPATQPGFVHVPAPAPASAGQQPLAASASSRSGPMAPAPPNKLDSVSSTALFEAEFQQTSGADVEIAGPRHAVTTFSHRGARKHRGVAQRPQTLESMHDVSEIDWQFLAVHPLDAQRVLANRLHTGNAYLALAVFAHVPSSSETNLS